MTLPSRAAVEAALDAINAVSNNRLTTRQREAFWKALGDFPAGAPQAGVANPPIFQADSGITLGTRTDAPSPTTDTPASVRGEISEEEILTLHADCENEFAAIADAFNEGRGLLLAETQLIRAILR